MFTCIQGVLNDDDLLVIERATKAGTFIDGKTTAGYRAKRVKSNRQLDSTSAAKKSLNKLVIDALESNKKFRSIAFPKRIKTPIISRYSPGMHYGMHVDDAIMRGGGEMRTDLAVTVFLNDPQTYDGGELFVTTSYGEVAIKLPRGDAVLYPCGALHQVAPVTRGERLAAVTWVQSHIRDPAQRELLADLQGVCDFLNQQHVDETQTTLAHKAHANLLRMWAEC